MEETGSFTVYRCVGRVIGYRNASGEEWIQGGDARSPEEALALFEVEREFILTCFPKLRRLNSGP